MNILIVGAGRLGYSLIRKLTNEGHRVTVIEKDRARSEKVANNFGMKNIYCCDGTTVESIAEAVKGRMPEVFIAAMNRDEDNLIACEIAKKQFKIEKVIAKSNDSKNVALMRSQGIDLILDETESLSRLVEQEIDKDKVQFVADITDDFTSLKMFMVNKKWKLSGTKLKDLELPAESILVYVRRGKDGFIPHGSTLLMAGDNIYAIVASKAASKQLKNLFC